MTMCCKFYLLFLIEDVFELTMAETLRLIPLSAHDILFRICARPLESNLGYILASELYRCLPMYPV